MADETIVIPANALDAFSLVIAQTLFSLGKRNLTTTVAQIVFLRAKLDEYLQVFSPRGTLSPLSKADREGLERLYAILEQAIQTVALGEGVDAPTKSVH